MRKPSGICQRCRLVAMGLALLVAGIATVGIVPEGSGRLLIQGQVVDDVGPVAGATVRVQATLNETSTDSEGRFFLEVPVEGGLVTVSAWKHLYYCANVEGVVPPAQDITLRLIRYQTADNPDFQWTPPIRDDSEGLSCAMCKPGVTAIWLSNAHAGAALNPRFLSMYQGTDLLGNRSPLTRYGFSRDYGSFPLPPIVDNTYFGPGYKLDFPETAGNCAACHIPGAAVDDPYGVDPATVSGANTFGVHCDYCHKVADVILDPATGMPYPNMPGVLSSDVRRPFPEDPQRYELFFGPFDDDNVPAEDTFLPLIQESAFCAPCHFGVFWDTVVYNSYGEWLDSPYTDPKTGQTCQACHMPAPSIVDGEVMTNVAPGKGGVERDPLTLRAHKQLGASDVELLQNAVSMSVEARVDGGELMVSVAITNDKTGHHIPTDSPLRHLILVVQAVDESGAFIPLVDGPILPAWCGEGDPADGYYAGLPGVAYAKILEELWTGVTPTGAYWNPTRVVSDNRIAALETAVSTYGFTMPGTGGVDLQVRLLFRRAFKPLMDQKPWNVPDILMEEYESTIPRGEHTPSSGA
jgi:hypothetical protein